MEINDQKLNKRDGMGVWNADVVNLKATENARVHLMEVPMFNGEGVDKQLLYKIVEMAREKNIKVLPLCPFANAMFRKLKDIQDVLKK